VRLGNILVIIQIHAQPSMMPLPTLSKVSDLILNGFVLQSHVPSYIIM